MLKHLLLVFFLVNGLNGVLAEEVQIAVGHTQPPVEFLYEEDPSLLTTTVRVVFLTGALDEKQGKGGTLNLLSELMLRGTKKKSRELFQSEIERLGGSLGVGVSHDKVTFTGEVISENTGAFLERLRQCILEPALTQQEFVKLKKEVLAEIANTKNNNQQLGGLAFRKEIFAGSPLEDPVRGTQKSVAAIQLTDLKNFYKEHFHRGNLLFAAAAPKTKAEIYGDLLKIADGLPLGKAKKRESLPLLVPDSLRLVVVHKPRTSSASILMGQSGIVAQEPTRFDLDTGNFVFGGEPLISRLFTVIRSELGWTYSVGSTYTALGTLSFQRSPFVMYINPSSEFTIKALFKALAMWDNYLGEGIKGEELKLAQNSLINSYPFRFESPEKRLYWKLYGYLYGVPILSPEQYAQTIEKISNESLKSALKQQHKNGTWLITIVADKRMIQSQLDEEQKEVPADKRLKISKVYLPDDIIR